MNREFRIAGCLLGGAVGDALGAPVEFLSTRDIRARFGPGGVAEFAPAYGRAGAITDDTQMTLFTAEGCLRAVTRGTLRGLCHAPSVIYQAYLRWLRTQGETSPEPVGLREAPGWLLGVEALHARRAPGMTCLGALRSGRMGTVQEPVNDSKGCGGVMRVAPIGLVGWGDPFRRACEAAAVTHGHPSGYLAAGAFALMVERLVAGETTAAAVDAALNRVAQEPEHEEVMGALRSAVALAASGEAPTPEAVEGLGGGWVAEEALAIAVYCALAAGDAFARGVLLAVNHGGDSDSTGAIAGNLLGARLGAGAIPARWLDGLELRVVVERVAEDLVTRYRDDEAWWARYPGC